jgi:hypothetical protein
MSATLIRGARAVSYPMPVPVSAYGACFAEAAELLGTPQKYLITDVGPGTAGYLVITTTDALAEWRAWQEPNE